MILRWISSPRNQSTKSRAALIRTRNKRLTRVIRFIDIWWMKNNLIPSLGWDRIIKIRHSIARWAVHGWVHFCDARSMSMAFEYYLSGWRGWRIKNNWMLFFTRLNDSSQCKNIWSLYKAERIAKHLSISSAILVGAEGREETLLSALRETPLICRKALSADEENKEIKLIW